MGLNLLRKRLAKSYSTAAFLGGLTAVATVLWSICMGVVSTVWPMSYPLPQNFQANVDSPALALELARSALDLNAIVPPGFNAYSLWLYELLNFVYIPLYVAYLVLLTLVYKSRKRLLYAALAALALSDVLKTTLAIRAIELGQARVHGATCARWLLFALVLALLSSVLFGNGKGPYSMATRRLFGLAYSAIALLLGLAVCFGQYQWLELGNRMFLLTALCNGVGLAGPAFTLEGYQLQTESEFCSRRRVAQIRAGDRPAFGPSRDTQK